MSQAGILRHMRPTPEGNLLIHQTATNRIMLVTPTPTGGSAATAKPAGS